MEAADGGTRTEGRVSALARRLFDRARRLLFPTVRERYSRVFSRLKAGDLAVDCGANVGDITRLLSANGATVHAFEPNPAAFRVLEERFRHQPNVVCHNAAVLDERREVRLYLHVNADDDPVYWSPGSSLLDYKANVDSSRFVDVPAVDLAEFIRGLARRVGVLKLDVEGVECRILHHLIDTGVIDAIDLVLVEAHAVRIPELKEETDQLRRRLQDLRIRHVHLDWI